MKTYQSISEGTWLELKPVQLTEEQRTLLISTNEDDREAKESLIEWMGSQREEVIEPKLSKLKAFYEAKKPKLKQEDSYQLISMDVSEKNGWFLGILNYRFNGEHKQIRF